MAAFNQQFSAFEYDPDTDSFTATLGNETFTFSNYDLCGMYFGNRDQNQLLWCIHNRLIDAGVNPYAHPEDVAAAVLGQDFKWGNN